MIFNHTLMDILSQSDDIIYYAALGVIYETTIYNPCSLILVQ